jgi:DNA-binding winged helix-turn-helix (wHTH) protein
MLNILLYSNNEQNINKIKKIIDKTDFNIRVINRAEDFNSLPGNIYIILFDITGLKDISEFTNLDSPKIIKSMDCLKKIALLNPEQQDILLSQDKIKFDDFCFNSHIDEELVLRIKSAAAIKVINRPENSIFVNGLILNLDKYELSVDGDPVELTFKEFELLKLLLENQNKVFTRNKLLSIIWEYDFYGGSRTIDVHIRRLRSKLSPPYNLMLKTVRNVGYMFSPQV